MKKILILILNYKTWEATLDIIEKIHEIPEMNAQCDILVVDNCSGRNVTDALKKCSASLDYILIEAEKNNGYAAGNNIGLRYASKHGYRYALVINNDIEFKDHRILEKMLHVFTEKNDIAIVSPDVYMPNGYLCNRDLVRPTIFDMTIGVLQYRNKGRGAAGSATGWYYSYRPQGCCMLLDVPKVKEAGYLDEYTFLYCEEPILAERLLRYGYRCACCMDTSIIHNHSLTVRTTLSKMTFLKSNLNSFDYYLKKYRKFNLVQRVWCNLFYVLKLIATKQL